MRRTAFALALGASLAAPFSALAAEADVTPRIVVTGEGESTVAPDLALLSLAVMREAKTAREALTANNQAMADVIKAMKEAGIADRDLQTAGVQINPRYDYPTKPDGSQEARLVAYQVTNTINIRIRDLDKTGEVIDKSVTLGVNQGGGITFTNDDPKAAQEDARKKAVADAMAKAKTLSESAGVSLGKVIEISETAYAQPPIPMMQAKAFARDAAQAAPVEAGENAYRVQVNITYELK